MGSIISTKPYTMDKIEFLSDKLHAARRKVDEIKLGQAITEDKIEKLMKQSREDQKTIQLVSDYADLLEKEIKYLESNPEPDVQQTAASYWVLSTTASAVSFTW